MLVCFEKKPYTHQPPIYHLGRPGSMDDSEWVVLVFVGRFGVCGVGSVFLGSLFVGLYRLWIDILSQG